MRPQGTRAWGVVGRVLLPAVAVVCLAGCGATSSEPKSSGGDASAKTASAKGGEGGAQKNERSEPRSVGIVAAAFVATAADEKAACRPGMVPIEGRFCIDRYEASLVEVLPNGEERAFSPFHTPRNEHVRAVSEPNVVPQGYISRNQAERACLASGKRLCDVAEWQQACRGPENKRFGYGDEREPGRCNDNGRNPVVRLFGFRYDASTMNQPQLNQLEGTLAKTGDHPGCSNGYGVYDMVGNLHEWVSDPSGTFYGGYYQDVSSVGHGEGCGYLTTAHEARYHDYSTGFRCCSDLLGNEPQASNAKSTGATKRSPAKVRTTKKPKKPKAPRPRTPKRRK